MVENHNDNSNNDQTVKFKKNHTLMTNNGSVNVSNILQLRT